jgi:hydroxyethylthiazole kinase-like sugar kinase family protein
MVKKKTAAKAARLEKPLTVAEPEPVLRMKEVPAAGGSFGGMVREMAGHIVENALDDPMTAVARVDSASSLAAKLLPTLPGEFPIPIPRGLYDNLPESVKKMNR